MAKTGMTQYMKDKAIKRGMKLFVLAESSRGCTLEINTGKTNAASEHELSYNMVMQLMQPSCLGTGDHIYMDTFYSSPKLFMDLARMRFGACGTYRDSRGGDAQEGRQMLSPRNVKEDQRGGSERAHLSL